MAVEVNWHKATGSVTGISGQNITTTGIAWSSTHVGDYIWFASTAHYYKITARIDANNITVTGDISGESTSDACARLEDDDPYAAIVFGFCSTAVHTMHQPPKAFSVYYQAMKDRSKFVKLWGHSGAFSYRGLPGFEFDDLTAQITIAPSHGVLFDEDGNQITGIGYDLPTDATKIVKYVPDASYSGTDFFKFTLSDGLHTSVEATIYLTVTATWVCYNEIPDPGFGINFARPTYNESNPDHYYIDADAVGATDTSNPNGTLTTPRITLPATVTATSGHPKYIFVKHAKYTDSTNWKGLTYTGVDANTPVMLIGIGAGLISRLYTDGSTDLTLRLHGTYIYFDNLDLPDIHPSMHYTPTATHVCYRHCTGRAKSGRTGVALDISGVTTGEHTNHVVVYDCFIHDNGYRVFNRDEIDIHGVGGGTYAEDVWILDNVIKHCGGDCIQFNGDAVSDADSPIRFYICGNDGGRSIENFCDLKKSFDMIVMHNRHGGYRAVSWPTGSGSDGTAQVIHDGAHVWVCKNWIIDANCGIRANGTGDVVYIEGNNIQDIHGSSSSSAIYQAMDIFNNAETYVVNNSIMNCDGGIEVQNGVGMITQVTGNFIHIIVDAHPHVEIDANVLATLDAFDNNFYEGEARIKYSGTVRTLAYMQANTAWEQSSLEGASGATLNAAGIIAIGSSSPLVGSGTLSDIYATYNTAYSKSLTHDLTGTSRPQNTDWDIGAYEFSFGSGGSGASNQMTLLLGVG